MSKPFVINKSSNLFAVVHSQAVVCPPSPRPVAVAKIVETFGLTADEASAALDAEYDPAEFRSTLASALMAELDWVVDTLGDVPDSETIAAVNLRLDLLQRNQQILHDCIAEDRQLQFEKERPARIEAEYERRRVDFAARGIVLTRYENELLRKIVSEDVQ